MKTGYIYSLAYKNKNEIFYIGSSLHPKIRVQQHRFRYFDEVSNRFVDYDRDQVKMEVVEKFRFKLRDELNELEEYWIHQFKQWGFSLRNTVHNRCPIYKTPYDIKLLLERYHPKMNTYRSVETDGFIQALYGIIRKLQAINTANNIK